MADTEKPAAFVVNGIEYKAPDEFTLGEMCDAENYFGVDFSQKTASARTIAATLYIAIRRVNPDITVDEIRNLPPDSFDVKNAEASPDPEMLEPEQEPNGTSGTSGKDSANGGGDPATIPSGSGMVS